MTLLGHRKYQYGCHESLQKIREKIRARKHL